MCFNLCKLLENKPVHEKLSCDTHSEERRSRAGLVHTSEQTVLLVQVGEDSPALSYSRKHFVTHRTFTERLKALLKKAGLDPSLFSGHSFRRGGASYLYSIGGSTLMVQVLGDWASQVFTRYLLLSLDDRLDAQHLILQSINATVGQDDIPIAFLQH